MPPAVSVAVPTSAPRRKLWLDWQRGLAVLFMVEVHVVDAWLADAARAPAGFWYAALTMLGGMAAPGFLYMAGVSQALADAAQEAKGVPPEARRRQALGRAWWLLKVAYAVRLVPYLLAWLPSLLHGWWGSFWSGMLAIPESDVVKVDVLNVIAIALAASALLQVGRPRRLGAWLAAAAAAGVVFLTPVTATLGRPPTPLVGYLFDYLHGRLPQAQFQLMNWAGFLLAGAAVARFVAGDGKVAGLPRGVVVLAAAAGLYALGAWADRWPPVYPHQDFWRTSPSWFAMRLAICIGLSGGLQLLPDAVDRGLGWLRLLGRQSLVGYVASVQLTYGVVAEPFRKALSFRDTVTGILALIVLTWAISLAWEAWQGWRKARAKAAAPPLATS